MSLALGNPDCPEDVRRAKRAQRSIEEMSVCRFDDDALDRPSAPVPVVTALIDVPVTQAGDDFDDLSIGASAESSKAIGDTGASINPDNHDMDKDPAAVPTPARTSATSSRTKKRKLEASPLKATPRLGKTASELFDLTRTLDNPKIGSQQTGTMSQTAARRFNVDKALENAASQQGETPLLAMMMMMDKRESERQARQDENERKLREEELKREERREEQRREDMRMNRMFMMMMVKMMGGVPGNSLSDNN